MAIRTLAQQSLLAWFNSVQTLGSPVGTVAEDIITPIPSFTDSATHTYKERASPITGTSYSRLAHNSIQRPKHGAIAMQVDFPMKMSLPMQDTTRSIYKTKRFKLN